MTIGRYRTNQILPIAVFALLVGCGRQEKSENKPTTYFHLKGEVVALDQASGLITISHDKIPGFMEAMTMPFNIKDTALFRGVDVGDTVRGVVALRKPELWLDTLVVVWKMPPSEPSR
jgi:protein SCO1/2